MAEDWLQRWHDGRTGWHEANGNAGLRRYWPAIGDGRRVLVPFCGASVDLRWLAERGCEVTGVELSPLAAEAFFDEQQLPYTLQKECGMTVYRADSLPLKIVCGDYFSFRADGFEALYDRGSLVAVPASARPAYVAHTDERLLPGPLRLVITLEYIQEAVAGPPYAVLPDELLSYWPGLRNLARHNDIDNAPPKFRENGIDEFIEALWLSGEHARDPS